ncbi:MAG: BMP family ABC transporter substrate-binding protein [Clostridiaceae bacterium]|nr:BMP family ABC transporter substrate-binding protein [Clostridiaceae bacterium]
MKKLLSLVLVISMVFSFAACSSGNTEATNSTEPSSSAPAEKAGVPKEELKIGFIHISDPSDMGYTYNHDLGTWAMVEALGLREDQIINKYNIGEDEGCAAAIDELIEAGCQIIFATSFGHGDYMKEAAMAHPEIEFCHATGDLASKAGLSNFHNYFTSIYEARYLAGIAAGMKLKELGETKLGYVAAFECAEVVSGFTAFYLGAKSVLPEATMDVIYTNSWHDPIKEAQVAQTLIDGGCKVISQHSDSTAPATTAEANGVFQVGYNADMISAAPKASLISARSDWSKYLIFAVQCVMEGKPIPTDWCQGLSEGAVYLSPLNTDIAAPGTQEAIDEAAEKIKSGELHVFAGPLSGTGKNWGTEGSIEIKEGEWFEESKEQSAPYWYYIIDGVNVLSY